MPIIELQGVSQEFGGLRALDGIDLKVEPNAIFGIIGPNGAGKTTLFNVITGIYAPTEGRLFFHGTDIASLSPYKVARLGIGRTFQNIRLFNRLSVLDNVKVAANWKRASGLLASLLGLPAYVREQRECSAKAEELINMMGLYEKRMEYAQSLSYGEQRRLEIARALAANPSLLLLDEPAAGMNSAEKLELMELIWKIRDDMQLTILLVEHDMHLVMNICETIAVLDYGRKIAEGDPAQIKSDPRVIQSYLGVER
ncbi:MAG: ABC transporter ATP-binding protein [Syntrophomonadaceae bacterium]|jgi:branched-chain amino acid transport system ATP-binding protein|nr:ABC transporter ATP-binding protein [Syntrophomonadaceae bacterium]